MEHAAENGVLGHHGMLQRVEYWITTEHAGEWSAGPSMLESRVQLSVGAEMEAYGAQAANLAITNIEWYNWQAQQKSHNL